jgi:ribose transport system substrate-binding protein
LPEHFDTYLFKEGDVMKKRFIVVLFLCVAVAFVLPFTGYAAAKKIKVGFSLWTMQFTFFQNLEKGVRDACEDFGFDYVMLDENSDPMKMVQDINSLVGQKVDGIVVTPIDPGAMGPAVQNARKAGIPVVCADIGKSGPVNALLISNNYKGGELAAQYLDTLFKKDKIKSKIVGCGDCLPQWTYARQRGEGFRDMAKKLGYTVGSNIVVAVASAEGGYDTMQQIMSAAPNVAGVFFVSGREATGAANAIKASGKKIHVVGYNGDPEELLAIKEGIMAATVAQEPWLIGYESVRIMKEILVDKKKYEDAVVPVDVELVTPDNLDAWAAKAEERRGQPAY